MAALMQTLAKPILITVVDIAALLSFNDCPAVRFAEVVATSPGDVELIVLAGCQMVNGSS